MNTSAFQILIGTSTNSDKVISVSDRIKNIIAEKLGKEEHDILDEASFADDLDVDSLDVSEIIVEIEKEFEITIPGEDMEKLTTVVKVINYVKKRKE